MCLHAVRLLSVATPSITPVLGLYSCKRYVVIPSWQAPVPRLALNFGLLRWRSLFVGMHAGFANRYLDNTYWSSALARVGPFAPVTRRFRWITAHHWAILRSCCKTPWDADTTNSKLFSCSCPHRTLSNVVQLKAPTNLRIVQVPLSRPLTALAGCLGASP